MRNVIINATPIKGSKPKNINITIEGDFNLHNAEEIKQQLLQNVKNAQHITLDLKNITDFDLSSLQILFALHKTIKNSNKNITLNYQLPDELFSVINHCGYAKLLNEINK